MYTLTRIQHCTAARKVLEGWRWQRPADRLAGSKRICAGALKLQDDELLSVDSILVNKNECRYCGSLIESAVPPFSRRLLAKSHVPHVDGVVDGNWAYYTCTLCDRREIFLEYKSAVAHMKMHLQDGTQVCISLRGILGTLLLLSREECTEGNSYNKIHGVTTLQPLVKDL